MMSPWMNQLVESHIEELHHQAAQQRPIRRMARHGCDGERRVTFERFKSRLGSYLVDVGLRLQTTTTRQSPLA
jgi:hypothetical protein